MKGWMKLLLVLLVAMLLGSGGYLAYDYLTGMKDEQDLNELAEQVASALERTQSEKTEDGEERAQDQTPRVVIAKIERMSAEPDAGTPSADEGRGQPSGEAQQTGAGQEQPSGEKEAERAGRDQPAGEAQQAGAGRDQPAGEAQQAGAGQEQPAGEAQQPEASPGRLASDTEGAQLLSTGEERSPTAPTPAPIGINSDEVIDIIQELISQDGAFANPAIETLRLKIEPQTEEDGAAALNPKVSAQVRGEFLRANPDLSWMENALSVKLGELGYRDSSIQILDLKVHIELVILPQYEALYEQNRDMIGWIQIDKTQVNYPVMQTQDDPEFYLRTNFKKESAYSGVPFMDARNDPNDKSQNLIVYGHNMKSGAMFGTIPNYESPSYRKSHPIIKFDLLTEEREYEVFGAFYSREYKEGEEGFRYYDYIDLKTLNAFTQYVDLVKKASFYDMGITPHWGDELLTLSTCSYHTSNGTFVVVARRVK